MVTQKQTLLVDRNYNFFECKFEKIPRSNPKAEIVHVFDGELVQDKSEDYVKFLIFDALVVNGVNVMNLTFENRLKSVKNQIIKKLRTKEYLEIQNKGTEDNEEDFEYLKLDEEDDTTIKVFLKDFFYDLHTKHLYEKIVPKLDHGNDGIVYTMNDCPYYPGTWQQIIKWKPAFMNSVDFNLKLITSYSDTEYIWGLYTRTFENPELLFDWIFFKDQEENEKYRKLVSDHNKLNKSVIMECAYKHELDYEHLLKYNKYKRLEMATDLPKEDSIKKDFKFSMELLEDHRAHLKGGWIAERQRTDKDFPNSMTVAKNIQETITDPVTVDDIIANAAKFMAKYSNSGVKRAAEPPLSNGHKRTKEQ